MTIRATSLTLLLAAALALGLMPVQAQDATVTDPAIHYEIGMKYFKGEGVPKDAGAALKWFRLAAEQGNAQAATALELIGVMTVPAPVGKDLLTLGPESIVLADGTVVNNGTETPEELFRLGAIYLNGTDVTKNEAVAAKLFTKAAAQGNARAYWNLGVLYLRGQGVEKDREGGYRLLLKSFELGEQQAAFDIGLCLASALGTTADEEGAARWFKFALWKGDERARPLLEQYGATIAKRKKEASALPPEKRIEFPQLTGMESSLVLYDLALNYATGTGVPKDPEISASLMKQSADAGFAKAKWQYGRFVLSGFGVEQSLEDGFSLLKELAEAGVTESYMDYGLCYELGWGVEISISEALKWYGLGARNGNPFAAERLDGIKSPMGGRLGQ